MSKENPYERSFFQHRFTLPGAVFFLVIIVINIEYIFNIIIDYLKNDREVIDIGISVIISGISLLSLTSFGFIFNQFWYCCNNRISQNYFETKDDPRIRDIVGDEYCKKNWKECMIIYHYYSNIANNNKILQRYLIRRWDMMNVLGSSIFSIIFGLLAGNALFYVLYQEWKDASPCVAILLSLFFVLVIFLIMGGIERIREEHREMTRYVTQLMRDHKKCI